MKTPMIKPSHKGLLHKDLGVPAGEKIGHAKLEAAKQSSDPAIRKRANFALNFNDNGMHGYVTGVRAHHSRPNYSIVEVSHGKRSKPRKGDTSFPGGYDDRPTSTLVIPKAHASKFHVGQRVGVGAVPLEGPDTDEMGDTGTDGDDDSGFADQDSFDNYRRSLRTGPAKKKARA